MRVWCDGKCDLDSKLLGLHELQDPIHWCGYMEGWYIEYSIGIVLVAQCGHLCTMWPFIEEAPSLCCRCLIMEGERMCHVCLLALKNTGEKDEDFK